MSIMTKLVSGKECNKIKEMATKMGLAFESLGEFFTSFHQPFKIFFGPLYVLLDTGQTKKEIFFGYYCIADLFPVQPTWFMGWNKESGLKISFTF